MTCSCAVVRWPGCREPPVGVGRRRATPYDPPMRRARTPPLAPRVSSGAVRLCVNGEATYDLERHLEKGDTIHIITALSGG
jgi:hypothetical protein